MVTKWAGSGPEVPSNLPSVRPEVDQKWTRSVRLSVRPKHFPYLLDEHYARELQAQGACALRFFLKKYLQLLILMCTTFIYRHSCILLLSASENCCIVYKIFLKTDREFLSYQKLIQNFHRARRHICFS